MSRVGYLMFLVLTSVSLAAVAVLCESTGAAQEKDKANVITPKIVTTDGVRLNVAFYPSPKKNSPTVIMLHPVGIDEGIHKPGWKTLAATLQKNHYSVAIFDFRGHGESKSIEEPADFWKMNVKGIKKATKEGDTIDVKDYVKSSAYAPVLVNDITAVKVFLDKRNDTGECNTGNTVVIGAESGATLGALWINSQWNCFKYVAPTPFAKPLIDKRAEGNDVVAAVWLNMQATVATRQITPSVVLKNACLDRAMPSAFFFGKDDTKGKDYAKAVVDKLKPKTSKKHDLIMSVEIPGTNLTGVKLLQKGLPTTDVILEFLDRAVSERNHDWELRKFDDTAFGWRNPLTKQFLPAKRKDQKMLRFDTYEQFIAQ